MTKSDRAEDRPSLDTVIRGFTDAELALREIAGAVERFRTASAQLSEARDDQVAVRQVLEETTSAAKLIADSVETLNGTVAKTLEVLQLLDPDRLWRQLDSLGRTARRATIIMTSGTLLALATLIIAAAVVAGALRIP